MPDILTNAGLDPIEFLEKLPGVYPLTAEQILTLVDDAMSAQASEMPGEDEWDNFVKQFLKSKGIEI